MKKETEPPSPAKEPPKEDPGMSKKKIEKWLRRHRKRLPRGRRGPIKH